MPIDIKNGFIPENLPEVVEKVKNDFKSIYGQELNLSDSTLDTNLIELLSQYSVDFQEKFNYILNQLNPNTAENVYLDNLSKIMGLSRKSGRPTSIVVNIENLMVGNTTVTFYSDDTNKVRISDGVNKYVSVNLVSQLNPTGKVDVVPSFYQPVEFVMEEIGGILPEPFDVDTWTVSYDKIETSNPLDPSVDYKKFHLKNVVSQEIGVASESDEEFRMRLMKGSQLGLTSKENLLQSLLQIDNIYDVLIVENDGSKNKYFYEPDKLILSPNSNGLHGLASIPHSEEVPFNHLYIIIDGGDYDKQLVADLIRKSKADGIGLYSMPWNSNGAGLITASQIVVNSLSQLFGYTQITWNNSTKIFVTMKIQTSPKSNLKADFNDIKLDREGLKEYLIRYFSTNLKFGDDLYSGDIEVLCSEFDNRFRFQITEMSSHWVDGTLRDTTVAGTSIDSGKLSRWIFSEKWSFSPTSFEFLN